jgi:hypothetical protein
MRPRRWLGRAALLIVSTLSCVGLAEWGLRVIGPSDEVAYTLDDQLVFRPDPGRSQRFVRFVENGGQVIESSFDRFGFRDDGRSDLSSQLGGTFVYGDSFVQASYSRQEDTFAGQLSGHLSRSMSRRVPVVNAGVDGYGPDQILLRLERDLPRHRPDHVVVTLLADNDFGDLIRNKLFLLDAAGELARHRFVLAEETLRHFATRSMRNDRSRVLSGLAEPALIKRDLRILLERRLGLRLGFLSDAAIETSFRSDPDVDWISAWVARGEQEFQNYVVEADSAVRLDHIRSDHYDADMSTRPRSEQTRYKVELMRLILAEIAAVVRRFEASLLLVIIPSAVDACEGYDWQVSESEYPEYERRFLSNSLDNLADSLAIPRVNLFDTFSGPECNELFFHHGNNHWNVDGPRRAAQVVFLEIHDSSPGPATVVNADERTNARGLADMIGNTWE